MKTLTSAFILLMSMLVVVPKIVNIPVKIQQPEILNDSYVENYPIRKKKQEIELLKSEISIVIAEIKQKLPIDDEAI